MRFQNYESDDSDDQLASDGGLAEQDEFAQNVRQQKQQAMALNDTWGSKKQNFYGRNKEDDDISDTDDDQDEQEQALRLQQIKAMKMSRFMKQQ
jgi:hypothetical protein